MKIFHGVEFSFGYNLTIEDDCTIHKYVMLDDRGEIIIRKGTSISDYASVYSHAHHAMNSQDIENRTRDWSARAHHLSRVGHGGVNVGKMPSWGRWRWPPASRAGLIAGGIPAKEIKKKSDPRRWLGA